jgi:hypothetical protein
VGCEREGSAPGRGFDGLVAVPLASVDDHARRKAIKLATADTLNRDVPASALMPSASPLEAVMLDVEREALKRDYLAGLLQLQSTVAGVRSAHAAVDEFALRGELVNLAAQAIRWASELPVPIRRRPHAKAAA